MPVQRKRHAPEAAPAPEPKPNRGALLLRSLERHCRLLAVGLVVLASLRIAATYTVFNHTFDEPAHIACGMEWLDKGIYQWEPQHPPLARVAAALGPFLSGVRSHGTPRLDEFSMWREGLAELYSDGHYDRALALARLGILPFFWIACWVVYYWGKRYFEKAAAVLALALFTFLPPILAHAGLATTDMAVTAFLGAAFLTGAIWMECPSVKVALLFGAATGMAILSKFSTLAFLPVCALIALVWYLAAQRPGFGSVTAALKTRAPSFVAAVLAAVFLVWAGYRFSFGNVAKFGASLPAPELFQGIQDVAKHNTEGHPQYLLGEINRNGWWYFYPVVLAVKTPLAFLLLLGVGLLRRHRSTWLPLAFAAGILLVGAFSRINIGVRHILPVYMAFALVAAAGTVYLLQNAGKRSWATRSLAALALWLAGSSLISHPDYLAYFNEFALREPERILVDSDLDWGQDVKRLAARLKSAGAREVTFANQMLADFESQHGFPRMIPEMDVTRPNPGWNAVSLTFLRTRRLGLFETHPEVALWPNQVKPQERVGKGILLWYFPPAANR